MNCLQLEGTLGQSHFRSFLGAEEGETVPTFKLMPFYRGDGGSGELFYALGQPWWVKLHWQLGHRSPVQSSHSRMPCGTPGGRGLNFGHGDSESVRCLVLSVLREVVPRYLRLALTLLCS